MLFSSLFIRNQKEIYLMFPVLSSKRINHFLKAKDINGNVLIQIFKLFYVTQLNWKFETRPINSFGIISEIPVNSF